MNANIVPITNEPAARWNSAIRSSAISVPIERKTTVITLWQIALISRFDMRSATAPPNGPSNAEARTCPRSTTPTALFFPVSSNATIDCTTVDMKKAVNDPSDPTHRIA